jgi:hypothetical protein
MIDIKILFAALGLAHAVPAVLECAFNPPLEKSFS